MLLPGFICAEVLTSLNAMGAVPRFYPVDESLCADFSSIEQIHSNGVRAAIAVNYFGFPQPLGALSDWCKRQGVVLLEDNAHGFLSRDGTVPLGRRGDLGVFSLRKTLSLPNGAALVDNRPCDIESGALQFKASSKKAEWKYRCKIFLKRMMAIGNVRVASHILGGIRMVRRGLTGSAVPSPSRELPMEAFAPRTHYLLHHCDFDYERSRRRFLYEYCLQLFAGSPDVRPFVETVPYGVIPQGFPFLYTGHDRFSFVHAWSQRGLPILSWPDRLPDLPGSPPPEHYRQVMLVPFLW